MKLLARGVIVLLAALVTFNLAACGDNDEGGFVLPIVKSLTVTPVNPTIATSTSLQLTATAIFFDNSVHDLTAAVQWVSSAPQLVPVGNAAGSKGLVTGRATGSAIITALVAGVSGATTVTVTSATLTSITITPPNFSIANGTGGRLIATGNFSDGTTQDLTAFVTWVSSAPSTAAVSNAAGSQGLVTGGAAGSATISASLGGVSGSTTVTITPATLTSITITPPNSSIANGTTQQLVATGSFSDGTTQDLTAFVTWASSNPSLATVSNAAGTQGLVKGVGVGGTNIIATFGGVSGSTGVTVTAAVLSSIVITPANSSLANGTSRQLTATGVFSDGTTQDLTTSATWISSATGIAQVSNAAGSQGLLTATGTGSTTISAIQAGVTGSTTVTVTQAVLKSIVVTPPNQSIANGTTTQLTATGTFSDGTTQDLTSTVSWTATSSPAGVATVDPTGLVHGTAIGSATIRATRDGVSGSTTVTVTQAVLTSIVVTPPNQSIANGTTTQLTATGTFSDGTTQDLTSTVSWTATSSPAGVATVDPTGLVHGTATGTATITATRDGVSGSTTVTVTQAVLKSIVVTPPNQSIANGTSTQLTATGTFSDGTTQNITSTVSWTATSSPAGVATVDPTGLVTATAPGTATITATQGGVSDSAMVTVTTATLVRLIVATVFFPAPAPPPPPPPPLTFSVAVKGTLHMIATAVFSDGTTQNVTQLKNCDWTSSDPTVASIISSSSIQTNGELNAKKVGTTTITAMFAGLQGTAIVNVTP